MRSVILTGGPSCFTACHGCYNHFARRSTDTETLVAFVIGLRDRLDLQKITVGGGDPLTRPDIVDLLARIRDLGVQIHLDTVGTALLRDADIKFMGRGVTRRVNAGEIAGLVDLVGIPLDGSTDAIMSTFRAHSAVADQQAVLQLLQDARATVCVNTVVHASNVGDMQALAQILSNYTVVRRWQIFQFMPIGPLGWRNRDRFEISPTAFTTAVHSARSAAPPGITVEAKANTDRKNRYLLIDAAGTLWVPEQTPSTDWTFDDRNGRRRSLGEVTDSDIFDRIAELGRM